MVAHFTFWVTIFFMPICFLFCFSFADSANSFLSTCVYHIKAVKNVLTKEVTFL
jgi:hypothetical protein